MKRMLSKRIAYIMTLIICLLSIFATVPVNAASNKALRLAYFFNGQTTEKNPDTSPFKNTYHIWMTGTTKSIAVKGLKMSSDFYIPKTALKPKNSSVSFTPYLDLFTTDSSFYGGLGCKITITAINENGRIKLYAWNEALQKNVSASIYASCKSGSGTYASYYLIRLKNIPIHDYIFLENQTFKKVNSTDKYLLNCGVSILGEGCKTAGKLYLDNFSFYTSGKVVINRAFTKAPAEYGVVNQDRDCTAKQLKIVTF